MLELGLGAKEALAGGQRGTVLAVFSKAAYVRLPLGLVALTGRDVPSGPIHARGALPPAPLAAGNVVTVDVAGTQVWQGWLPTAAELEACAGVALEVLDRAPASPLAGHPRVAGAVDRYRRDDLHGVVEALAGFGPGLTPAGDDALAGILLVERIRRGAPPTEAAPAKTNDIARAFLAWAARGQCIEPVHRFLGAAVRKDTGGAMAALGSLVCVGASSGADLAFGLRVAIAKSA